MGTYTTNYQLYTPTVGETGWGELVNGNFTTIDTTMKGLSNRITAVENEVNGNLSCTSVTASGKITGNGGIAGTTGTFSGAVTGSTINGATITSTKFNGATIASNGNITAGTFNGVTLKSSGTITVTPTNSAVGYLTVAQNNNYVANYGFLTLLPYAGNARYTGSIKFISTKVATASVMYWTGLTNAVQNLALGSVNTVVTLTFSNIPHLVVTGNASDVKYYGFTLS